MLMYKDIGTNPYENRFIRKLIDTCAFNIYSPWVKRGEEQNRAALFETKPKMSIRVSKRSNDMTNLSSPPPSFVVS